MKVKEFCNQHNGEVFYLIPREVINQRITPKPLDMGLRYEKVNTIPIVIQESNVVKWWKEEDIHMTIIVWENHYDS